MITPDFRKKMADSWFSYLQSQICKEFEYLEKNKVRFSKREWSKKTQVTISNSTIHTHFKTFNNTKSGTEQRRKLV